MPSVRLMWIGALITFLSALSRIVIDSIRMWIPNAAFVIEFINQRIVFLISWLRIWSVILNLMVGRPVQLTWWYFQGGNLLHCYRYRVMEDCSKMKKQKWNKEMNLVSRNCWLIDCGWLMRLIWSLHADSLSRDKTKQPLSKNVWKLQSF